MYFEVEADCAKHEDEGTSIKQMVLASRWLEKHHIKHIHIYIMCWEQWHFAIEANTKEEAEAITARFNSDRCKVEDEPILMQIKGEISPDKKHWSFKKTYRELFEEL